MKRRAVQPEATATTPDEFLCRALLTMKTEEEVRAFLRDLLTPAEFEAASDRWRVVPYLRAGLAYREIHDRTAVSVTTVGRVARFLQSGFGGYQLAEQRLKRRGQWPVPKAEDEGEA